MVVVPVPSLLSLPVLAELRQTDLITSVECSPSCMWPYAISDVVTVQSRKFPGVVLQTTGVLQRHGFEEESKLLAGRQYRPTSVCPCYVAVKHPFKICVGGSESWLVTVLCGSRVETCIITM